MGKKARKNSWDKTLERHKKVPPYYFVIDISGINARSSYPFGDVLPWEFICGIEMAASFAYTKPKKKKIENKKQNSQVIRETRRYSGFK